MSRQTPKRMSEPPAIGRVGLGDLGASLRAGLRDFLRAPSFGLVFSAFYVAGGVLLALVAATSGKEWWLLPLVIGFPLLAPFAAVGLYEVSRRIEASESLIWREVLGVVFAQKDRQIPSMALVILFIFVCWVLMAHLLLALFLDAEALSDLPALRVALGAGNGPLLLAVGSVICAGFWVVLFAITVAGLPLLLDRDLRFSSAIGFSLRAVFANPAVLGVWGLMVAALLLVGMAPLFLGLFVVLPVLGHASWHLYRRLTRR